MKLREVAEATGAKVICGERHLNDEVDSAFGSDMMSDVLAYVKPTTLVLTGMVNSHVIRTADMLDIKCLLFVRGKCVTQEIIDSAQEREMVILSTPMTMYEACGRLYGTGLPACSKE
ncbi:MAG: DRTGG domain-containing protein [Clostridia bacterium]|nr:DRTGG domain-containing protein [Clostridia bacterium]